MLIEVKRKVAHGEFMPWVADNCSFAYRTANRYMLVAQAKVQAPEFFAQCNSIDEAEGFKKPKKEPQPERRAPTLNDLRKVERLRALRDDPAAS